MDANTRKQLSNRLAGVYEELTAIIAQREVVDQYVGSFALTYMVDEELAYLGGDSTATTYFGCTITQGRTTVLDGLDTMEKVLESVLEQLDDEED